MPKIGLPELVVILIIVIVLFGANKLPQLGAGLGQGIRSFKKAISGGDKDEDEKKGADEAPKSDGKQ